MSLANVSLVGNLVKAPEQIQFSSGRIKTTLVVAVNGTNKSVANKSDGSKLDGRKGEGDSEKSDRSEANYPNKGNATADFYRVETWGKLAELASKYLNKGNQVTVSGKLTLDHWTDKHGANRITPVVEANQLSLPPKPKSSEFDTSEKGAS
ncbi:MAG: single-stranded DNA-binding protein [Candidatus Obscuribacterales bacterium]|jgi:single stranded DNA-binding protein